MTAVRDATLPPYPDGWYAVAYADELPRGAVVVRPFMGQEIVLFRTASGAVCGVEPYCPHLGAHLGHGGRVEGESLRCPFHGFCFDRSGACVATSYGKRPPKARLGVFHVREQSGLVLAHSDATSAAPGWEVPPLDMTGWTPLTRRQWTLRGHPQETTENSVDVGHLAVVHGYRNVTELAPLETKGPYLTVRYAMDRPVVPLLPALRVEFTIHAHGLGYSLVEVQAPALGLETRQFVLVTPLDEHRVTMRIALCMRALPGRYAAAALTRGPASRALSAIAMAAFAHDVQQDFAIWSHKRHVSPPVLAEGDGPIGAYRRWTKQFYPPAASPAARPAGPDEGRQAALDADEGRQAPLDRGDDARPD